MINLLWGAHLLFQAAAAVPLGIAALAAGQLGNEWAKSGKKNSDENKKDSAAAEKKPAAEVKPEPKAAKEK